MHDAILRAIGDGIPLRGHRFQASRGKGDKARVTFTMQAHWDTIARGRSLPAEKDPKESLVELWGLGNVRLGDDDEPGIVFPVAS
jgi:hypothetical protein